MRLHCEWVWNGERLYIVQADKDTPKEGGVSPKELVRTSFEPVVHEDLKIFRVVEDKDFDKFRKLKNARIYKQI